MHGDDRSTLPVSPNASSGDTGAYRAAWRFRDMSSRFHVQSVSPSARIADGASSEGVQRIGEDLFDIVVALAFLFCEMPIESGAFPVAISDSSAF